MGNKIVYTGRDLESMSFAINYHQWILDEFKPYFGNNLVEVGAGTGSFSELLLQMNPHSLSLVEPSAMFDHLRQNLSDFPTNTVIDFYHSIFTDTAENIKLKQSPDSVIYVNVLEHIEHDTDELKIVHQMLPIGGKCFIFVPAQSWLYGRFDSKIGHFRRYSKTELTHKLESAGFRTLKLKNFDLAGVLPWFVKYKILKSDSLEPKTVEIYDRFAVPIVRKFEQHFSVPLGKNLLAIGEKI